MTTIGFDLDMTLIDSRPGIKAVYDLLAAESGVAIDTELVSSRLGPPLEVELANWVAEADITRWADRYRELYPTVALPLIEVLPGARAALDAANRRGRTIVITAKNADNAQLHIDRLDLPVSAVHGEAWREGKAAVLSAEGAVAFVGDHVHDMEAAQLAGVAGIGVATGPSSAVELHEAGAATVLTSLDEFAAWLDEH